MHLLVLDTETGGLEPACHPLLEIGAVLVSESLEDRGSFDALVQPYPGSVLDPASLSVSGIDLGLLGREGLPESQALEGLVGSVSGALAAGPVVIAGWNVGFDQAFLVAAFRRQGMAWPFGHRFLDVQSVWAFVNRWDFGGLTLASQKLFGSEPPHRAMSDARIALDVLRVCAARSAPLSW